MDEVDLLRDQQIGTDSLVDLLFSSEAGMILAYNSLLLIGTVILYGLLLFATRQTLVVSSRRIEFDIRNDIVRKLMTLPQRCFVDNNAGEIYVRTTEDVTRVREYFARVVMYTITSITPAAVFDTTVILVTLNVPC